MASIGDVEGTIRLRDEFTAALTKASTQLRQAGDTATKVGAQMSQAGSAMTRSITLPLVALGAVAIKSFSDFDAAMTKSTAIMGDLSDVMRNDMVEAAKEVALTTSFSAKAAGESFFFLASAGLSAEASIAALPAVAQFAQAGMFDMATATDLLTDAQSALGLTIRDDAIANMENMIRVSDVLAKANVLSNATIQQFSESLTSEAGAAMKVFSKDVEEGVAVLAAFADQGIKGNVAGTGLSRIMRLLSAATIKNKDALDEYNIEIFDSFGAMNNMADIIGDLEEAFGDMSDEARTAALDQIGFKARVQGVILPLLGTSEAIREYEAELRKAGGTTAEIAANQLQSFAEKMRLVKDRVIDAAITLGGELADALESLIPLMNKVIDGMKFIAVMFGKLPTPIKLTIIGLFSLLAAMGPILLVAGGLIAAFGQVALALSSLGPFIAKAIKGTGLLAKAFNAVAGVVGGGGGIMSVLGRLIGFLTGPVGIAVSIGIALLAWKPFRDVVFEFGKVLINVIKVALTPFVALLKGLWSLVGPLVSAIGEIASAILGVLGDALVWAAKGLAELNEGFDEVLNQTNAKAFEGATKGANELAESAQHMADIFTDFGESGLKTWLKNLDQSLISVGDLKSGLGILSETGAVTAEEFEILRLALIAVGEAGEDVGDGLTDAERALIAFQKEVAKAVETLGLMTESGALDSIEMLSLAMESADVPASVLAAAVLALEAELEEVAKTSPNVTKELAALRAEADQDAIAVLKLNEAMSTFGIKTVGEALPKIAQLTLLIEEGAASPAILAVAVLALEEEFAALAAMQPEVRMALEGTRTQMIEEAIAALELEAAIKGLNLIELSDLEGELAAIDAAFRASAGSPKQLEDALAALLKKAKDFEDADLAAEIEILAKQMAVAAVVAGRVVDPFKKFADVISDLGIKTIPATLAKLKDIPAAIRAGVIPVDQLGAKVDKLDAELKELAKDSPAVAAALRLIEDAARDMGAELSKDTGIFGKFKDKLSEGVGGLTDPNNIAGLIGTASDSFLSGDFLGGIEEIVSQIGATIGAAFGPLGKMVGQLAGKLVPLIAGIFSKPEFKKVAKDAGRDLGVELSDELAKTIAERSKELGNRFAAITEAIPEIIAEAGIKSGQALDTFVARARDNLVLLSTGVFTSAEAFGNLGESLALLIPEMDNFGATTQRVDAIFETLTTALDQVRTGLATTKDAAKLLGETFPLLVERLDDMGVAGVIGIRNIINETRALGIEVQAVTDFVVAQTSKIVGGVDMILSSLRTRIDQLPEGLNFGKAFRKAQKEAKEGGVAMGIAIAGGVAEGVLSPKLQAAIVGIGTQAKFAAGAIATVFAEALASGVPITQIVEDTKGQIKELGAIFDELGIKAPASFDKISKFARKLGRKDVAPVIEGVQGIGQAMQGLRDLGLATQEDFSDFGTTLTSSFDQLKASGLSQNEIFAALGPQLQQLADLQREFGFEVDAGTQSLLDQATASGVVKGAQLDTADAVSAGFQGLFDRFDAFLEKQGIATEGMFNFGEQATDAMGQVSGATETASTTMAEGFQAASAASTTAVQTASEIIVSTMQGAGQLSGEAMVQLEALTRQKLIEMGTSAEETAMALSSGFLKGTDEAKLALQNLAIASEAALLEISQGSEVASGTIVSTMQEAEILSGEAMVGLEALTRQKLIEMGTSAEEAALAISQGIFKGTDEAVVALQNLKTASDAAMLEISQGSEVASVSMATGFESASMASTTAIQTFSQEAATGYQAVALEAEGTAVNVTESFVDGFQAISLSSSTEMDKVAEASNSAADEVKTGFMDAAGDVEDSVFQLSEGVSTAFSEMKDDVVIEIEEIGSATGDGLQLVEDQFTSVTDAGTSSFREIGEAAEQAARDAIDAFEEMEDELVGASVFPDTAEAASTDLHAIGNAAEQAASAAEHAFQSANLSMGSELSDEIHRIQARLQSGDFEGEDEQAALERRVAELLAEQQNLGGTDGVGPRLVTGGDDKLLEQDQDRDGRDGDGKLRSRGFPDGFDINREVRGAGGDLTINLVVDGQILAKTVLKNMPRALANSGLANRNI